MLMKVAEKMHFFLLRKRFVQVKEDIKKEINRRIIMKIKITSHWDGLDNVDLKNS